MGKVKYLIIAAGLFVCFVMTFVAIQGVRLTERRIIKWSTVSSGAAAGEKVAAFMYPIINEYQSIALIGEGAFVESFATSFITTVAIQNPESQVLKDLTDPAQAKFVVHFVNVSDETLEPSCQQGQSQACVAMKSVRLFTKKARTSDEDWISMYRLNKSQALVIYRAQ